jgi:OOP family OmpA-OmpF porin
MKKSASLHTSARTPFGVRALALTIATAMALPGAAMAEEPGTIELGIAGGYDLKHETNELGDAPGFANSTEVPKSGPIVVLRAGYTLMERLSLEIEAGNTFSEMGKTGAGANILNIRGHALFNLLTAGRVRPFVRVGAGTEWLMTDSDVVGDKQDADTVFVAGIGSRFGLTDNLALRLDLLGLGVPTRNDEIGAEFEALLGLSYFLGGKTSDTDMDGISDKEDKCPVVAEDKDDWKDDDGCPDPDNDGDGFLDADDKCPNEAENKNGFEDTDGCPDDPDTDGDGIVDTKDKCVKEPETKNGFEDEDGCPDSLPDADKDGIPDKDDKCVKEPETKNGYEDADGCPDKVPEKLKRFTGAIKGIEFEVGSATILPGSFKTLDNAIKVLQEFKDTRVEISGHTDSTGDAELNKKLSADRAASVKTYFVEKGMDAGRIDTIGYGPEKPVGDNKTKAGKAKNRRIEFRLL